MRNKFISLIVATLIIYNNMYHIQPVYAIGEKKTNQKRKQTELYQMRTQLMKIHKYIFI